MPRKLKFVNDTVIEDKPYSIYLDEETGQRISIPHDVAMQASFDPLTTAMRERDSMRKAQSTALEAQKIATPQPDPAMVHRDKLQSLLDQFERDRQASVLRRRDALLNRPPLSQPVPIPMNAGPQDEMSPGMPFSDMLAEMRRRATGR